MIDMPQRKERKMIVITFTEDVTLRLRRGPTGKKQLSRRFLSGDTVDAEFMGEDNDINTIDFELPDGTLALAVPRYLVAVKPVKT
jgi:hypothetical protein